MEIGIAGAGLAGRLLAWQLLKQGHQVSLFDRDDGSGQRSAGFIAAAMLAPCSELVAATPAVYEPGVQSLDRWSHWLAELLADTAIAVDFQRRGSLVVAHRADHMDMEWFYNRLQATPNVLAEQYQWLTETELLALEPELSNFNEGIHLTAEGCLDNRALFRALHRAIENQAGTWHCHQNVRSVEPGRILTGDDNIHEFDMALDCRGFGAKDQLKNFRGVRGEILWVQAPDVRLSRPVRLMHPRYQLYIAPKPDNLYAIGATEIESDSLAPVTVRSSLELLSALYSIHSGFGEAVVLEARSHCRPAFMDNLPRIIRQPGLLRINGLYRHGYLLAPALIDSTLAVLNGQPAQAPISVEDVGALATNSHSTCNEVAL
jgi:glycine oxidase